MKQTIKRIIVAILGVALLISAVAFTSSCKKCEDKKPPVQPPYVDDSKVVIGNLIYQLVDDDYNDNGTPAYYTVIGISNRDANRVVIPAEAYGTPVKAIAADAFYGNANLESVEIPSSVTKIGERAFAACTSLSSIEVAADSAAFKSVDGDLYTVDGAVLVQYAIGKDDASFAVPAGVTEISAYAFAGSGIESLTLSEELVTIGEFAFASNKFKSIEIPASVESIAGSAFDFCSSLAAINVDASNAAYKSVDGNLYTKTDSTFVRYAVGKSGRSFSVASGTLAIGDYAFSGATLLENISLPGSLTSIGEFAFLDCESLKSLSIPGSVSAIAPSAFDNCYNLASFTVNAQNRTFSAASGVLMRDSASAIVKYPPAKTDTKYDVSGSVISIGDFAFADAVNLKKLNLSSRLEHIGVDAFEGCKVLDFNTSSSVNYLGTASNQYYALISLSESAEDNTLKSVSTRSNTVLIAGGAFKGNKKIEDITLSSTVKYVCDDAFAYCTALEMIDFRNVVKIHSGALSHCTSLTSIVFNNSVKLIEDNAIFDCPSIKRVFYYNVASSEEWEELKTNPNNPLIEGKQDCGSYNNAIRYYYSAGVPTSAGNYWYYVSGNPVIWTTEGEVIVSKGLEFTLNASGSHYIVSGIGEFDGIGLVIPATYNKKPVKEIGGGAFVGNDKIVSVVLPYSIESVGANAFTDCSNLSVITLPDSVTFIGAGAFKNCIDLSSIDIPDGVAFIEPETFAGCTGISRVILPDNLSAIRASAFYGCEMLSIISLPYGTLSIGDSAFYGCDDLEGISFPETLCEIGNNAFTASGLNSVEIPASVLWIGDSAFRGCESLMSINVHEDNTEYSSTNGVLYREVNGDPVTLICCPSGYIYPQTPTDKRADVTLILPDTVKTIAPYAVLSENLRIINISENTCLEVIGDYAFAGSTALAYIELPATIKSIGKYAFESSGASGLTVKDGARFTIGEGAFKNCAKLNTITLPEGTLSIARHAFYGCSALTELEIPDSVTDIGILAFACNSRLKTVTVGNGITTLAGSVFAECVALEKVTISAYVSEIADTAFSGCKALQEIIVASGNTTYKAIDGVLYTADGKTLVLFPASRAESFEIPDGVTTIGDLAFSGSSIVNVVIPDSVTVIGDSAFSVCRALASITIGEKLESIGANAFAGCTSLVSLDFVESATALTVGDLAFSGCESLKAITLPDRITELGVGAFKNCRHIESVKIGDGITEIKKDTFSGDDNIEWIVLGTGVTAIRENAFNGCIELAVIYCVGNSDSYLAIRIASGNEALNNANRYHYSATNPNIPMYYWHYASDGSVVFW